MSYNSNLSKRIRTHNTEIISKTQLALEAIKKYQARNNRVFQRSKNILNNPYSIFREIDDQYTRLHFHKELQLDKIMRLQILPFNQQYFCIDTDLLIFPVRIFLKNVRNQGILYVGYDREYPGVERFDDQVKIQTERNQNNQKQTNNKTDKNDKKLYDFKFAFNKDMICVLKNQKKKSIRKIYLTIVSKKQLLMLNIKFDYIGYVSYEQEIINRPKRAFTQGNILINSPFMLPSTSKKIHQLHLQNQYALRQDQVYRNQSLNLKRSQTQNDSSPFVLKNNASTDRLDQYLDDNKKGKNFLLQNLNKIKSHRRQNSKQQLQMKKQKQLQIKQRIKINKEQLEQFKQKQRQIKQQASKLKKSIELYQKIYKQQKLRDRKTTNTLTPLIYLSIFMQKSNKAYNLQTQSITKAFTVRHFIKKFTKNLRKKYIQSILQIGNFKIRNQMSCMHIFQLTSKMILPITSNKAGNVLFDTFTTLQPALMLNHSLNQSSKYRQCCRIIQRRWILKYRARLKMLQNFASRHIQNMFKQFPHLRLCLNTYKTGNHSYKVCYQYMTDQSIKFKHIYQAYRKRIQQINQFIKANQKIRQYNKGKPQNKKKKYIQIPNKPICPQHRFFRNLDILKSMLRSWFEIQYKKILKKSISGK